MSLKLDTEALSGVPTPSGSAQALYLDSTTGKWYSKTNAGTSYAVGGVATLGTIAASGVAIFADSTGQTLESVSPLPIALGGTGSTTAPTAPVTQVTGTGNINSSGGTTPVITFTGVLPISGGGTNSNTQNFVDLSSGQTIAGIKTLSSPPVFSGASITAASISNTALAGPLNGVLDVTKYGIASSNSASTNTTALSALVGPSGTAPNGSTIYFPPSATAYAFNSNITVGPNMYIFQGAGSNRAGSPATAYTMLAIGTSTNGFLTLTAGYWYTQFRDICFLATTAQTSGAAVAVGNNVGVNFYRCAFQAQSSTTTWFDCINYLGGNSANSTLVTDCNISGFTNYGISLNSNGASLVLVNTIIQGQYGTSTQVAAAGVQVVQAGALQIDNSDIIGSTNNLLIAPTTGLVVASVFVQNTYFDNSSGSCVKITGAGATVRTKFSGCSMTLASTAAGFAAIEISTTVAAGAQGIDFNDCNVLNTFGTTGTSYGFNITGGADFSINACRIAGWTTGVTITPISGGTTAPFISQNVIGPTGGYSLNTNGIVLATGTYAALMIENNNCSGNTTNLTNSATAPTTTTAPYFRITDNAGINPKGTVTTPTIASATLFTNTTMYRVTAYLKSGTTAPTVLTINGVSMTGALPLISQVYPIALDPGGTVQFTYTVAPTWVWVAN